MGVKYFFFHYLALTTYGGGLEYLHRNPEL
jgi:hypothetical protein